MPRTRTASSVNISFYLLLFYLLVLVLLALCASSSQLLSSHHELVQLVGLILLALLLSHLSILGIAVPKLLLGTMVLCGVILFFFSYKPFIVPEHSIILTRLKGDGYGNETRLLEDELQKQITQQASQYGVKSVRVISSNVRLQNTKEGNSILNNSEHNGAIIWGNTHWLWVNFNQEWQDLFVEKLSTWGKWLKQPLHLHLPRIGLSVQPRNGTANFIATIVLGMTNIHNDNSPLNGTSFTQLEHTLLNVGTMVAGWTSYAHRAFPWWMLGNLYLLESIDDGYYEPGELNCALDAYRKAQKFLRPIDNPALFNAIKHNSYFVKELLSRMEGSGKSKKHFGALKKNKLHNKKRKKNKKTKKYD